MRLHVEYGFDRFVFFAVIFGRVWRAVVGGLACRHFNDVQKRYAGLVLMGISSIVCVLRGDTRHDCSQNRQGVISRCLGGFLSIDSC